VRLSGIGKKAVILPSAVMVATGVGMTSLGMIFYMREVYQATPTAIGGLAALWSLAYSGGCLALRPLFRSMLPRHSMLIATLLLGLFPLAMVAARSLVLASILYGLFGLSLSLFWPPVMGWLSYGYEGRRLSRTMSHFNLSWSAGIVLGPVSAGFLSERRTEAPLQGASLILLCSALLSLVASIFLPAIKKDRYRERKSGDFAQEPDTSTPLRFPAWIGHFASYVVVGVLTNILPIYAAEALGISRGLIGLLLLSRSLVGMVAFFFLGQTSFWHFKSWQIVGTQVCMALVLTLMIFARTYTALQLLIALVGFLIAVSYSNSLFHGVTGCPRRAARMAMHETILTAGIVAGSTTGGWLYHRSSMTTVYLFCIFLLALGVVIQGSMILKIRRDRISTIRRERPF
jgi:MFS family permease